MRVGRAKIEVVTGSIVDLNVDAYVNPANDLLWMGGGVSASIRRACGKSMEDEAASHAPARIGDTVMTGGGSSRTKHIIHAVVSGQDLVTSESTVEEAITTALQTADEAKCASIAIPLPVTEHGGIEVHRLARVCVKVIVDYLIDKNKNLIRCVLVDTEDDTITIIRDSLMEMFSRHDR